MRKLILLFAVVLVAFTTGNAQNPATEDKEMIEVGKDSVSTDLLIKALEDHEMYRESKSDSILQEAYLNSLGSYVLIEKVKSKETYNRVKDFKGQRMLHVEQMFDTKEPVLRKVPYNQQTYNAWIVKEKAKHLSND